MEGKEIRAVVVDDEEGSRRLLIKLINTFHADIKLLGEAADAGTAVNLIRDMQPNLVFLDIELAHETGFDVLDRIGLRNLNIIMVTAHSDYAAKAFRYDVIDYLLKPIDIDQLDAAIKKVVEKWNHDGKKTGVSEILNFIQNNSAVPLNRIAIPSAGGYLLYPTDDIVYCQAVNNYTHICLATDKTIVSSYTLKHYDDMLSQKNFFRVHKSYLVNLRHITQYRRDGTLLMTNGAEIDVSRFVKGSFARVLKEKFSNLG